MELDNLNEIIENLINTCMILIPMHIADSIVKIKDNRIKLKRVSEYDGCLIKECTFSNNINTKKIKNNQKNLDELLYLTEKLSNYTSEENLKTLKRNLKYLSVKKRPLLILKAIGGYYDTSNNTLKYSLKQSLGHEFLHLSSSYYNSETKETYTGFKQFKNNLSIGIGLNEGYTELLASRIYNKKNKVTAYKPCVKFARLFEFFFENPKDMETFYFNHDLLGFIKHMEQFTSTNEIIKLLLQMDKITIYNSNCNVFLNTIASYEAVKVQLKLYKLFLANNKDKEKMERFTNLVCKNKVISLILSDKVMKLYRENPYVKNKDSQNEKNKQKKLYRNNINKNH